eukprot:13965406-Alexandrium_andersonii.AAC.1
MTSTTPVPPPLRYTRASLRRSPARRGCHCHPLSSRLRRSCKSAKSARGVPGAGRARTADGDVNT